MDDKGDGDARNQKRQSESYNRWKNITEVMLGTINNETLFKARSISVVPDELRKWNEDSYVPKVISIGHRFNGRQELLPMEEIKWRSMFHLFSRSLGYTLSPEKYINNCMRAILKMDVAVRSSYVGEINLDMHDLAAIVFNDGCFLLEYLISGSSSIDSIIPPYGGRISTTIAPSPTLEIAKIVMGDLTLLENQIPFFVLDVLFRNMFDKGFHYLIHEIHKRALSLFGFHGDSNSVDFKFAHFLELASWNINKEWEGLQMVENNLETHSIVVDIISEHVEYHHQQCLNRCATKLKAYGVTIKPVINVDNPPNTQVTSSTLKFGMRFSDNSGILEIPQVRVTRAMKAKWLNLIAWEHHKKWIKPKSSSSDTGNEHQHWRVATSSALLFNDLICCSSDIQLLKDKEVIVVDDDLKKMRKRDLVALFHSLTNGVDRGIIDPKYSTNFDALNKYSAAKWNKRIPILLLHYYSRFFNWFRTFWKFLGQGYNFAATAVTYSPLYKRFMQSSAINFPNPPS